MLPLEQLPGPSKNLCEIQTVLPLGQCNNTLTYSQELSVLASQSPNLLKSIPMPSQFCDRTGGISRFIPSSELTDVLGVTSTFLEQDFHVQASQELEQTWTKCLSDLTEDRLGELEADICTEERSSQSVQRSLLEELNILISASREKLPLEHDRTVNTYSKKLLSEQQISEDDSEWIRLYDCLAGLEKERTAIYALGPIAKSGVWIEYGKVSKRKFRQAYYRSEKAIFTSKGLGI